MASRRIIAKPTIVRPVAKTVAKTLPVVNRAPARIVRSAVSPAPKATQYTQDEEDEEEEEELYEQLYDEEEEEEVDEEEEEVYVPPIRQPASTRRVSFPATSAVSPTVRKSAVIKVTTPTSPAKITPILRRPAAAISPPIKSVLRRPAAGSSTQVVSPASRRPAAKTPVNFMTLIDSLNRGFDQNIADRIAQDIADNGWTKIKGYTALSYAVHKKEHQLVEDLLSRGDELEITDPGFHDTPDHTILDMIIDNLDYKTLIAIIKTDSVENLGLFYNDDVYHQVFDDSYYDSLNAKQKDDLLSLQDLIAYQMDFWHDKNIVNINFDTTDDIKNHISNAYSTYIQNKYRI